MKLGHALRDEEGDAMRLGSDANAGEEEGDAMRFSGDADVGEEETAAGVHGGRVLHEESLSLRHFATKLNLHVDRDGLAAAGWADHGTWQTFQIGREAWRKGKVIESGDAIYLRSHLGKHLGVYTDGRESEGHVRAKGDRWERDTAFIIRKLNGGTGPIRYGEHVFLEFRDKSLYVGMDSGKGRYAPHGKYELWHYPSHPRITVSSTNGFWQEFVVESSDRTCSICDWSPNLPEDGPLKSRENALMVLGSLAEAVYDSEFRDKDSWKVAVQGIGELTKAQKAAYVSEDYPDVVVVAFRGTQGTGDIFKDLTIVNNGPTMAFEDAMDFTKRVRAKFPDKKVYVTGQSLGGFFSEAVAATLSTPGAAFASPGPNKKLRGFMGVYRPPFEVHMTQCDPIMGSFPEFPNIQWTHIAQPQFHDGKCHGCTLPYYGRGGCDNNCMDEPEGWSVPTLVKSVLLVPNDKVRKQEQCKKYRKGSPGWAVMGEASKYWGPM